MSVQEEIQHFHLARLLRAKECVALSRNTRHVSVLRRAVRARRRKAGGG